MTGVHEREGSLTVNNNELEVSMLATAERWTSEQMEPPDVLQNGEIIQKMA